MQPNWSQTLINLTVLIQAGILSNFTTAMQQLSEILCHQRTHNQESVNTDKLMLKPCMCHQRVGQPHIE